MSHVSISSSAMQGLRMATTRATKPTPSHSHAVLESGPASGTSATSPSHQVREARGISGAPGKAGLSQPFGKLVSALVPQLHEVEEPTSGESVAPTIAPPLEEAGLVTPVTAEEGEPLAMENSLPTQQPTEPSLGQFDLLHNSCESARATATLSGSYPVRIRIRDSAIGTP